MLSLSLPFTLYRVHFSESPSRNDICSMVFGSACFPVRLPTTQVNPLLRWTSLLAEPWRGPNTRSYPLDIVFPGLRQRWVDFYHLLPCCCCRCQKVGGVSTAFPLLYVEAESIRQRLILLHHRVTDHELHPRRRTARGKKIRGRAEVLLGGSAVRVPPHGGVPTAGPRARPPALRDAVLAEKYAGPKCPARLRSFLRQKRGVMQVLSGTTPCPVTW